MVFQSFVRRIVVWVAIDRLVVSIVFWPIDLVNRAVMFKIDSGFLPAWGTLECNYLVALVWNDYFQYLTSGLLLNFFFF